ncbi:MAG: class I SAM-dependent methyltransferase [Gemmatimonadetes bacterium]|nr:class I SAM-dependent methyltransferase [Gemmatimonadota bacterium]
MDSDLRKSMFAYYEARAPEYDEIYDLGGSAASISAPDAYRSEAWILLDLVGEHCRGHILDIPCGTAFWLPAYAASCPSITLVDQSAGMLSQSRERSREIGVESRCEFIRADVLEHPFTEDCYDSALVGFFLSHLTDAQLEKFFQTLKRTLRPGGHFLILDSIWSDERARSRGKEGRQSRTLNDGRQFDIYKRYFDRAVFAEFEQRYYLTLEIAHAGRVFITAVGTFSGYSV